MEQIPTSPTPLIRQPPLCTHNTIANCTLALPLQRTCHILPPRHQSLDQPATATRAREVNDTCGGKEPSTPFLLVNADAVDGGDGGGGEGI